MEINKLQSDYVNEQNYRCLDVWFTTYAEEEGTTVAYFCEDTGKSIISDNRFIDSTVINTTLEVLKHDFDLIKLAKLQKERTNILAEIKKIKHK